MADVAGNARLYLDGAEIGNIIRIGDSSPTFSMGASGTVKVEATAGSKWATLTPTGGAVDSFEIMVEINGDTYPWRYQQIGMWQSWRSNFINEKVALTVRQVVSGTEHIIDLGSCIVDSVVINEVIDNGGGGNVTFSFTGTGGAMKISTNVLNGDFIIPLGDTEQYMLGAYGWQSNCFASLRSALSNKTYRAAQTTDGSGLIASFNSAGISPTPSVSQTLTALSTVDPIKDVLIVRAIVTAIERDTPEGSPRGDMRQRFVMKLHNGTTSYGTIHEIDINTLDGVTCSIACPMKPSMGHIFSFTFPYVCRIKIVKVWAEVISNTGV